MVSGKFFRSVLLATALWVGGAASGVQPSVRVVQPLDKVEPYAPLLFHGNNLWVVTSVVEGEKTRYDVNLFAADGRGPLARVRVPHTAEHLYAFGPNTALLVGKSSWPWKTHYTVLTKNGSTLKARTTTFPEAIQTEQFGGAPNQMFFNDVGDRKVFRWDGRQAHPLKPEISGPGQMVLDGGFLFVLKRRSFQLGDENVIRIRLSDQSAEPVFTDFLRQGLTTLVPVQGTSWLAAAEGLAGQVLLIDRSTNKLAATIAIPGGTPRGLAQLGHCLVVGSDVSRKLSFFDLRQTPSRLVAEWDLVTHGAKIENLFSIAVDPVSGRVYGRSKDICAGCTVSRNAVVLAEDASGETLRACTAKP